MTLYSLTNTAGATWFFDATSPTEALLALHVDAGYGGAVWIEDGHLAFRDDETRDLLGDVDRWTIAEAATLAVDEENAGATWWDAVYEADDIPAAMRQMVYGRASSIPVHAADLPDLLQWCASLPGWNDGPAYAPHPLTVR